MKKVLALIMSVMLVLCVGVVVVCADPGAFAPSIEVKEAPDVVAPDDADVGVVAVISGGSEEMSVANDELFITSLSEAKDKTDEVSVALVEAYNDVKSVEKVEDKVKGMDKALEDLGFDNAKVSVANIFDVSVIDDHKDALGEENAYITVIFTNDIKATQDTLLVAHIVEDEWKLVDAENVKVDEKTITVNFDDLCPVMFMTVTEGEPVAPASNGWVIWVIVGVVVVAAAAAVAFVVLKKKKAN